MDLLNNQQISFSLPTVDGKTITDKSYGGQWLLLVFHRHLG